MSIVIRKYANGQVYREAVKCHLCPDRSKPQSCVVITNWDAHIALCLKFHWPEVVRAVT